MGIQSTVDISREYVIRRIRKICSLVDNNDYLGVERTSFEPDEDVEEFVNNGYKDIDLGNLDLYTNKMLERIIDRPFFRNSMFDNYIVLDESE